MGHRVGGVKRGTDGTLLGLVLVFAGVVAFSLTLPMTRLAVAELGAAQLALWRAVVAAAAAVVVLALLRPARPRGRQWALLAGCAVGTVFGFPMFTTLGMQTVSATHGAVVVGLLPLATAVCGVALGGERPSTTFWVAALAGTALTLGFVLRQAEGGIAIGHVWLLAAVLTAAIGYAYGALAARALAGWSVACWTLVVSLPVLVALVPVVPPPSLAASPATLGAFLYLALVSQLGGFFAFYRGLALAGIARGSQVQLLQLFLTVGFAIAFFGERAEGETLLFGALVVVAVAVGTRSRVRDAGSSRARVGAGRVGFRAVRARRDEP